MQPALSTQAFKSSFSRCYSPLGLVNMNPLIFKVRCCAGLSLKCRAQKLRCLMWGLSPSLLWEKLWVLFPPCLWAVLHEELGLWRSVVQTLLPALAQFSSHWADVQSSLRQPLGFYLRGNCSIWSCRLSVSMGGWEFRIFQSRFLN